MTTRGQLSQQEIDALLAGASGENGFGQASGENRPARSEAQPLDVAGLEHITRGSLPTLELVNERFRKHLVEGLAKLTGRQPEILPGELKVQKYSAFVAQLASPAHCSILSIRPLRGQALVVCEQALVFAIVDALFGGSGSLQPRWLGRDFSAMEQRVMQDLVALIADSCRLAWRGVLPLSLDLQRTESQAQFANITGAGERVLTSSFQIEIGELAGALHICLTHASLEPVRELLRPGLQGDDLEGDQRWSASLRHAVPALEVTLDARFAPLDATVAQLLAMKVGDFIGLDGERRVDATVDGVPLFECLYGTRNAKYAIRVVKSLGGP